MARLHAGLIGGMGMFAAVAGAMAPTARAATVNPTADTYINSSSPNTNYGSDPSLVTNEANGNSSKRYVYIQFDLSSLDLAHNTLSSIELDLVHDGNNHNLSTAVYGLLDADDTWSESTLTWNNDPNRSGNVLNLASAYGGTTLATFTATAAAGTDVAFNVSSGPVLDYINADADKIVTFVIVSQYTGSYPYGMSWDSADSASPPELKLTLTAVSIPEPASLGVMGLAGLLGLGRRRRG